MNSKINSKSFLVTTMIITLIFATLTGCNKDFVKQIKFTKTNLSIKNSDGKSIPIVVEIAKTQEEQVTGFMNRKKIPSGTGMLFIYDKDTKLSFWMKNTPTPLSIAFIDSSGKIREIYDMEALSTSSTKSTYSVRYALEVPKGWFTEKNITCGDVLDVSTLK